MTQASQWAINVRGFGYVRFIDLSKKGAAPILGTRDEAQHFNRRQKDHAMFLLKKWKQDGVFHPLKVNADELAKRAEHEAMVARSFRNGREVPALLIRRIPDEQAAS